MKKLLFILSLFIFCLQSKAQDIHFSQFYDMPLWRNPSLAGLFTGSFRAQTIFRNQWQTVKVPYNTAALGVEYKAKGYCIDDNLAIIIGLQLLRDQAGISKFTRTEILGTTTVRTKINDNLHLSVGLIAGSAMNSYSNEGLSWGDQYINDQYSPQNPTAQPFASMKKSYLDIGGGASLNSGTDGSWQWYVGGAMYHASKPVIGFTPNDETRLQPRFTINGGLGFNLSGDSPDKLVFYGDYIWQGRQWEALLGAYCTLYTVKDMDDADDEGFDISFGALYRYQDAVIPVVKLNFSRVTVGVSYDANISTLSLASHTIGAVECSLKYRGILEWQTGKCGRRGCFN